MKPAPFSYTRSDAVAGALAGLKSLEDGRVIAGGQSLGPMLNLRLAEPKHLVDISRLADLCGAELEDHQLAIGACVTHAEIEDGKIPDVTLGLMTFVARGIAYRAVRNRGTIGGSLAHADPAADWLTTTIAMDATVRLAGPAGTREVKVADFVIGAMDTALGEGESSPTCLYRGCRPLLIGAMPNTPRSSVISRSRWRSPSSMRNAACRVWCWAAGPSRPH